ncbi:MAG: sulfatase-like hydrolase/transferase [Planctomycetaceae bacterium]
MRNMLIAVVLLTKLSFTGLADEIQRPNVLFIAIDDLRNELGCYGVEAIQSPHIDELAASGVAFRRAYCQQAVCNPSRVSLMTGMRPDSTRVWDLITEMRSVIPDAVTVPQHFRSHGYRAVAYGKIFHNPFPDAASWDEPTHNPQGVISYSEDNRLRLAEYRKQMKKDGRPQSVIARMRGPATEVQQQPETKNYDGKQTRDALEKMTELARGEKPFFLAVGYIRPHLPFIVPQPYWELYNRDQIPLATNSFLPRDSPAVAFGNRSLGGFYEIRAYMDYADAPSPFERPLSVHQQRELKHGYYASVSFIDAQVGLLLQQLESLDLHQNTIVVLWGDHGWKLGEHGAWCKQTNYEIDTRAPLMIRAPGAKANGTMSNALVEFVDIYPTLCELAALPVPESVEGTSLVPILKGESSSVKEAAYSQFPRTHEGREYMGYAMRTDRYRYIEWQDQTTGSVTAQELYDHSNDPDENQNIAGRPEHEGLLTLLSEQMWKERPRPPVPHPFVTLRNTRTAAARRSAADLPALAWVPHEGMSLPVSRPAGIPQAVTFINAGRETIELFWRSQKDTEESYGTLVPGDRKVIRSRPGAVWAIRTEQNQLLGHFLVEERPQNAARAIIPEKR